MGTYRHIDIQTYRHTDIQTYRHTDIQTYGSDHNTSSITLFLVEVKMGWSESFEKLLILFIVASEASDLIFKIVIFHDVPCCTLVVLNLHREEVEVGVEVQISWGCPNSSETPC